MISFLLPLFLLGLLALAQATGFYPCSSCQSLFFIDSLARSISSMYTNFAVSLMFSFRAVIQQLRKEMKMRKPPSVPVTREFLREMDKELLAKVNGDWKNINPRIVAEVMTDKSLVANICTPDQRRRFVDLMTEILTEYGGEDGGAGKIQ